MQGTPGYSPASQKRWLATQLQARACRLCGLPCADDGVLDPPIFGAELRHAGALPAGAFVWAHTSCARMAAEDRPALEALQEQTGKSCKHWAARGRCEFRESCFFGHPQSALDELAQKQAAKAVAAGDKAARRAAARWRRPQQPVREGAKERRKRVAVRKQDRAGVLRRFVVRKFGAERLRRGSGVLDVAGGGASSLGFELQNLSSIPCTVVDPRPMKLDKCFRQMQVMMICWCFAGARAGARADARAGARARADALPSATSARAVREKRGVCGGQ